MERLYELHGEGNYDLIVVDTPPTRNALDFLEAPGKLAKFLDERIITIFLPGKTRGLFKKASELIGNVFSRVFGTEFFSELQEFLAAFSGMFGPMRAHAEGVRKLLSSKDAAFLLVTSPDQAALEDARYFRDRIVGMGLPFAGFVLNRSRATDAGRPMPSLADDAPALAREALPRLSALAELEKKAAARDLGLLEELKKRAAPQGTAIALPELPQGADDIATLITVGDRLAAS
jgi:anion-transporting  ArsA/GET3 family ATPase